MPANEPLDLIADLNAEDDDGLGWSVLTDARVPEQVRPGALILAGNAHGHAVVRVVAVDDDGQVLPHGEHRQSGPRIRA